VNRRSISILLAGIVLLASVLACEGSFSTAKVSDAWMSSDSDGSNRTTTFAQDAVFYAQVELSNAPDDTKVKAVWTAVDAEGVDANSELDSAEYESGDAVITFHLENNNLWPAGQYKVDIYLNDEVAKTLTFEVEQTQAIEAQGPYISDAWMSSDGAGSDRTTTFTPDAIFYAQAELAGAPDDTQLKATWTAVSAEGVDPGYVIDEAEYTSGDGVIYFELSNTNPWPVGQYQVDIYLNSQLTETLTFEVR